MTQAFADTVRQFPRWKEFVGNARDKAHLPTSAEAADLAKALSIELRADESGLVAPIIPDTLDALAKPLTWTTDEIERGKDLLVADVVQSVSNIAGSAARWIGKKTAKYGKALDGGIDSQLNASGKKDGERLVKWGRKTLGGIVAAIAGWAVIPSELAWIKLVWEFLSRFV